MTITQRATTTISTLGPISVTRDGQDVVLGGEKQRAVLGILLARAGAAVDRDVLIEGVWGADASDSNVASLHTYVSNLRALTGLAITRSGSTYTLEVEPDELDHLAFERLVEESRALVTTNPADAAERLRTGLGWWKGRPYANVADCPGLQSEIRRLEELRIEAVELRIEADLAAGHHGKLISELEALVGEHPMRERFRAQQMLALYRAGRQSEALRAYRRACEYLSEEAGLDPSPELADLELKILQQDDALLAGISQSITERRAFLFTDIEGSTRLWDMHPDAMGRALNRHDEILRTAISAEGGKAFKHTGDGLLAAFSTVGAAVAAAESAQRALHTEDWGVLEAIKVRMGVDVGDVDVRGDDFFGPPLNRCARIMSAGHGGQVLLSLAAQEELTRSPIEGVQVRYLGEHRLRGLGEAERIGQLVFIGLPAEFPELRTHVSGPDPTGMESGDSLRGYELREQIGVGAFGVVYRAYQPSVGREVAIKVIRPEFANHPSFVRRFESEARLVAQLEHPHIVPLFDFWRDQDGAYLVMRLMRGGTLRPAMDGAWSPLDAVELVRQVGGALGAAHRQGVVHRDFKPGNILLDDEGNAYLADFGIAARIMEPTEVGSLPTSAPRYRAPEETRGLPADQRSDVYSLAVLTHELLTGDRVSDRPAPVTDVRPDLPEALNGVIARATALNIEDRYASVGDYLDALTDSLGDLVDLPAEPPSRSEIRNPFKGLRPFDESDRGDFFGRDNLVQTLVSAMQRRRLVTAIGPSGSGKSSVVRAGLLPRLRTGAIPGSDDWLYVTFTPGTHPFDSLADALQTVAIEQLPDLSERLAADGLTDIASELLDGLEGDLLLILDQFEEAFTLVDDADTKDRFLRVLTESVETEGSRVRVLATLRADFFDRPLAYEHIGPHVSDGHVTVIPPTRAELVEAIEKPTLAVGLRLEPGLAARIAGDVAEQPGGLPLMQYALTELVDARGTDVLTADDYEAIGGVTGALGRRAEQVFANLSRPHQDAARQILLRLVTVDEHTDDTRRRAKRSELETLDIDPAAVSDVVDAFGRHRLLSFDRDATTRSPTVEVAHEALLREWPRLRSWIEGQREGLILGRRFQMAMADWKAADRADGYLLTGDRLAPFAQWATTASLTADETGFLNASREADEAVEVAGRRRRRILTGVLAGATAISLAFGAFALVQRGEAQDNAAQAEQSAQLADAAAEQAQQDEAAARAAEANAVEQARLARSRELGASAVAVVGDDPELATLLALEAAAESGQPVGAQPQALIDVLRTSLTEDRLVRVIDPGFGGAMHIGLSEDGSRLAVSSADGAWLGVYSHPDGDLLWEITQDTADSFHTVYFSPSGDRIAVSVLDSRARSSSPTREGDDEGNPARVLILDAADGRVLNTIEYPGCSSAVGYGWSPDGSVFAVSSGFLEGSTTADPDAVLCDRPDTTLGTWLELLGGTSFESLTVIDTASDSAGPDVAFDDNGNLVLLNKNAETVIYSGPDYSEARQVPGSDGDGDVSPDGSQLFLNQDFPLLVDAETGSRVDYLQPLPAQVVPFEGAAFSPDGTLLVIQTVGRRTVVWNIATGNPVFELPSGAVGGNPVITPDSKWLYTSHSDGTVKRWDLGARIGGSVPVGDLTPFDWVNGTGFAIGPSLGAFEAIDFETFEWGGFFFDLETGNLVGEPIPEKGPMKALADGRFVVEGGLPNFGELRIYDPATGERNYLAGCPWTERGPDARCVDTGEPALFWRADVSLDGTELILRGLTLTPSGFLGAWSIVDADDLTVVDSAEESVLLSEFIVAFNENWIIGQVGPDNIVLDRAQNTEITRFPVVGSRSEVAPSLTRVAQVSDQSIALTQFDTWQSETLEFESSFGRVRGVGFSPDERFLAVGGEALYIVDLELGTIVQSFPITGVSDVHWLDDATLVIGTNTGVFATVSRDLNQLGDIATSSLTRSFTAEECATYGIDPCPTLDEIRNR